MRFNSSENVYLPNGTVWERRISTFDAVLHCAEVFIDDRPTAFAYVERVMYAKDFPGHCGYLATKYDIDCILRLGGARYYIPVAALAEVVGKIERKKVHFILINREPFSEDQ